MRMAVAGAGVGGLALAVALRRRGIGAEVFERAPELEEAGAGVQLGPNAVKVLNGLGVGDAVRAAAFRPEAAEVRAADGGRLLLSTPLGAAAERRWGAPFLQIHRADLQAALRVAAVEAGAELRLGSAVEALDPAGGVRLADGGEVRADAAVGADGLRSTAAASLWGAEPARFTGQTAFRALVPREAVAAEVPPVAAVWTGRGRHLVHYPVRGGREINVVAVVEQRRWREEGWTVPGDPAELLRAFAGWPSPVPQILAAVSRTWRWALFDRPPRPLWSRGAATLLGDAAHPMLPFLAQGAAMAVEDAAVLAEALAGGLAGGAGTEAALAAYERARRPRTARVQAWSRTNARLFHLPPLLAHAAFALGARTGAAEARLDALYGWESDPTLGRTP